MIGTVIVGDSEPTVPAWVKTMPNGGQKEKSMI